jgi:hypothetical protein
LASDADASTFAVATPRPAILWTVPQRYLTVIENQAKLIENQGQIMHCLKCQKLSGQARSFMTAIRHRNIGKRRKSNAAGGRKEKVGIAHK